MSFVLDTSVTMSWLLDDAAPRGQSFAEAVLELLKRPGIEAHVPGTWGLEVANVIARSETRGLVLENESEMFLATLAAMPIVVDRQTSAKALTTTLQLARRYRLSVYDASYLELALRAALPIATLDDGLLKACRKAGVRRLEPR